MAKRQQPEPVTTYTDETIKDWALFEPTKKATA